ncbi:MAG: hypothetical protein A2Y62_03940 [Candidatus Fischerbacteria bacterium RBG_13_37_8]|uniref:Uncharacterized protein n=1 Tax=Candidatus Fischerbacteria bacterium RBG_13_37_8 TaxID=1817863 RepID=A0A1F5V5H1_9BACT|nr:MAG: hypothetical protein A2Y62_03940 [Candidatus Fischerbacteria bacterium RBG_13_37_8]
MNDLKIVIRGQLSCQVAHWTAAVSRLQNMEAMASAGAWNNLEQYLGVSIRQHLIEVVNHLKRQANLLYAALDAASSLSDLEAVQRQLLLFRKQYLRAETTLDFYSDAINTRTNPTITGLLKACDILAYRSMANILDQLGKKIPVVLTYLDKGLGASILKAGLRLWDLISQSPVAAIKIARHNLQRPTAIIHEAGHQVAHITSWDKELGSVLKEELKKISTDLAEVWVIWASEIAADAFAFVNTGFASVAALRTVLAGETDLVLRHIPGDPHPISYIRILLCMEMCRQSYGNGPWDELAIAWTHQYPINKAITDTESLIKTSLPLLQNIADIILHKPMQVFRSRALSSLIDPSRVSPKALEELEQTRGIALYTSMHWIWTEALRLLALTGLRTEIMPEQATELCKQQEIWMMRLGGAIQAA